MTWPSLAPIWNVSRLAPTADARELHGFSGGAKRREQRDAVELRLRADLVDLASQLRNLRNDRVLVDRVQGAAVVLNGQRTDRLEHLLHVVQGAIGGLNERRRVVGVVGGLVQAVDLSAQILGNRVTGCVIGSRVDPKTR